MLLTVAFIRVRPRHDLAVLAPAAVHRPRIACHLGHGHGDFWVDVGTACGCTGTWKMAAACPGSSGTKDVILRDVSFDERDGAQQPVLRVAAGLYGITLIMVRLDADDAVRTLIPLAIFGVEMSTSLMGSGMT